MTPIAAQVALLIATAIAAALVALRIARRRAARQRSRRARTVGATAAAGERDGAALLEAAGFAITGRQVRHTIVVAVDGERYDAGLRCDYLVERAGEAWVAEIKTGDDAPSLTNPATRRQLLEYQVAYAVVGVVLVDATAGAVHEVRFELTPPASAPTRGGAGLAFTVGVAAGVAAALALGFA
ncbi:MAG: hypothetical protein R3B06_09060 [Kofleriaceae bacterium]